MDLWPPTRSLVWSPPALTQRRLCGQKSLLVSHSTPRFALFLSYLPICSLIPIPLKYLGLHPFVFKNSATKAIGFVQTARQAAVSINSIFNKPSAPSSTPVAAITASPVSPAEAAGARSSWSKWAAPVAYGVGGLLLSGAAAGAAYYKRNDIGQGYQWATDHMKYVGTLWDEKKLRKRLDELLEIEESLGVIFREYVLRSWPRCI